jgi:hypothetical protein
VIKDNPVEGNKRQSKRRPREAVARYFLETEGTHKAEELRERKE